MQGRVTPVRDSGMFRAGAVTGEDRGMRDRGMRDRGMRDRGMQDRGMPGADLTTKRYMRCPTVMPASAQRDGGVHHQVYGRTVTSPPCAARCVCLSCCR